MTRWLPDVKDGDKVGLMILYTGLLTCGLATCGYLFIVYHSGTLYEAVEDRALAGIKDFFGIGFSLITAAMGALRFQSKNGNGTPKDEPPK